MTIAVFAGTFDPPTNGHKWVAESLMGTFSEVHVFLGFHPRKTPLLHEDVRMSLLRQCLMADRVETRDDDDIMRYVESLRSSGEEDIVLIRGVRNGEDVQYEQNIEDGQRRRGEWYAPTLYVIPPGDLEISSSEVRKRWNMGLSISHLVPEPVVEAMEQRRQEIMNAMRAARMDPFANCGSLQQSASGHRIPMDDPEAAPMNADMEAMRTYYYKLQAYGFIRYEEEIGNAQVKAMLDPFPYNVATSETYHLRTVPIDMVKPVGRRWVDKTRSLGPILIDVNVLQNTEYDPGSDVMIIEGKHRWLEAKERGDETIQAWVGAKALAKTKFVY